MDKTKARDTTNESPNALGSDNSRKLRVLIITQGGLRQQALQEQFQQSSAYRSDPSNGERLQDDFEPPVFSPGISSRRLRNRYSFLEVMNQVGLLPEQEWEAIHSHLKPDDDPSENSPNMGHSAPTLAECLQNIPISSENRRGSPADLAVHYSEELWFKGRSIHRGRAVLACTLAHLQAMRFFVQDGTMDIICEDNVRFSPRESARRIREAARSSVEWQQQNQLQAETTIGPGFDFPRRQCQLRYVGWLGSQLNLEWMFRSHIPQRRFQRSTPQQVYDPEGEISIVSFPTTQEVDYDINELHYRGQDETLLQKGQDSLSPSVQSEGKTQPGGTPIWGQYGYWISRQAYNHIMDVLRNDVGAILWKNKRMRTYQVKPVDKMIPRIVGSGFGWDSVHVSTHPAIFRAPMLTSQIHKQWDVSFANSTSYQLDQSGMVWEDLALTEQERQTIRHYRATGEWNDST